MNRQFFDNYRKGRYLNLADVSSTTARGTSFTGYRNQGTMFSGDLSDAAKARLVALSSVEEAKLLPGNFQYNARYRSLYPDTSAVTFTSGEITSGTVDEFNTNYKDGKIIEPTQRSVGTSVQWNANRNNIYDLMKDKQDELSYALATKIENFILNDSTYGLISATQMTNTVRGYSLLFGGSATADSGIVSGNILTTELVNKARTRLLSKTAYYWTGGTETIASIVKNPWPNEAEDPIILIVGPEQQEALTNDSQFRNADQYGGNEPLLTGEIGKFFGVRIVLSQYLPTTSSGGTAWDSTTAATDLVRCIMMKGRAAYTFVWGQEPSFEIDKTIKQTKDDMVLWSTYSGSVVHDDAICFIDVAVY